jgi:hypothetical protein
MDVSLRHRLIVIFLGPDDTPLTPENQTFLPIFPISHIGGQNPTIRIREPCQAHIHTFI